MCEHGHGEGPAKCPVCNGQSDKGGMLAQIGIWGALVGVVLVLSAIFTLV